MEFNFNDCQASLKQDILHIHNSRISRKWRIMSDCLQAISLQSQTTGKEWLRATDDCPGINAPGNLKLNPQKTTFNAAQRKPSPVSAEALCIELKIDSNKGDVTFCAVIYPQTPAITMQLSFPVTVQNSGQTTAEDGPSGVEEDPAPQISGLIQQDIQEYFKFSSLHLTLRNYELFDQTDRNDNLLHLQEWRVSPKQKINLKGCLFSVEDVLDNESVILLKHAPLPAHRPDKCEIDLLNHKQDIALGGHCAGDTGTGYRWSVLLGVNSTAGVTASLQKLQQQQRVYTPGLDGVALANTWGDRNRDACVNEAFMLKEIEVAAEMGVDACQIDDGWQQGTSSNSAEAAAKGGVWEGFYAADPDFWQPHPQRFPNGLQPLVEKCNELGVELGLWFAPDSVDDFINHEKDAANIARMHKEWGVRWVKIDGVKARGKTGEKRLLDLFHNALVGCKGDLCFDQDITAEIRPGYWPLPETGPLFVENRYSDWGCWWPHATLRNLWQLTHIINPSRLRMEILNIDRNRERYEGDPLAPETYDPAFIFATIMVSSPLFWCELSSLSEKSRNSLKPLLKIWKNYRQELHTATCHPVGDCPTGTNFSGFFCDSSDVAHLLAFRQLSKNGEYSFALPFDCSDYRIEKIYGEGDFSFSRNHADISLAQPNSFLWLRMTK